MGDVSPIRVLGVDPGLTRCGVGLITGPVSNPRAEHFECIRTTAELPLEQRLLFVHDALAAVVAAFRPHVVAVEQVLFSTNVRTAMATGQAAGVALLSAAEAQLPVVAYSPTQIKATVAGSGTADKDAVARMVAAQLSMASPPRPVDVSDALAVGLTHLARSRMTTAARGTAAARQLEDARVSAARAARNGWEAVLGDRIAASEARSSGAQR